MSNANQVELSHSLNGWIRSFPAASMRRLTHINKATNSASHVILAVGYGTFDKRIFELNKLITALLIARMRAERNGAEHRVRRINSYMTLLHEAIDAATGVPASLGKGGNPCNRPLPQKRAG